MSSSSLARRRPDFSFRQRFRLVKYLRRETRALPERLSQPRQGTRSFAHLTARGAVDPPSRAAVPIPLVENNLDISISAAGNFARSAWLCDGGRGEFNA